MRIKYFFITLVLYSLLLLPFKFIFSIIPGYEMKLITFFPAVLGIFWGPPVAFGVGGANFIVDLLARNDVYVALTSSIANFFQAYIPFKLWYTFRYREEETYFFIHDMKSIAKFIYILSLTSLTISAMFGMIVESGRLNFSRDTFVAFFLNNFDFALVLGVPILILLANSRIRRYRPVKDTLNTRPKAWYDVYLYLVLLAGIGYLCFVEQGMQVSGTAAFATWCGMFVCMVLFSQKPIVCEEAAEIVLDKNRLLDGMVKKYVMLGFFCGVVLLCAGTMFFACLTLESGVFVDNAKAWRFICMVMFSGLHILFILALLMMYLGRKRLLQILEGEERIVVPLQVINAAENEPAIARPKEDEAAKKPPDRAVVEAEQPEAKQEDENNAAKKNAAPPKDEPPQEAEKNGNDEKKETPNP